MKHDEAFEPSAELTAAMNRVLNDGADFAVLANQAYSAGDQESAAACAKLFGAYAMVVYVRMTIARDQRRIAYGFVNVADGVWHPVIVLDAFKGKMPTAQ